MERRSYTAEFKRAAVCLVVERGQPVTRAARQLEVHEGVLRRWVRDYQAEPAQAFDARRTESDGVRETSDVS
ncbi:MAG: transposase [Gammaproteobacteria bacterium]|nr:transposase [Gammaproteobacteria bacterium]